MGHSLTRRAAMFGAAVSTVALAVPAVAAIQRKPDVHSIVEFLRNDKNCTVGVHEDRQRIADMLEGNVLPVAAASPLDRVHYHTNQLAKALNEQSPGQWSARVDMKVGMVWCVKRQGSDASSQGVLIAYA